MGDLNGLTGALRTFASDRDWDQFHTPRNLAAALVVEAGELLEHFQWMTDAASQELTSAQKSAVAHEVGDVLLYLIRLSDKLGLDPVAAAEAKLIVNASKYPVDKSRGSSKKYTEL